MTAAKVGLPFLPGSEAAFVNLCWLPFGCLVFGSLKKDAKRKQLIPHQYYPLEARRGTCLRAVAPQDCAHAVSTFTVPGQGSCRAQSGLTLVVWDLQLHSQMENKGFMGKSKKIQDQYKRPMSQFRDWKDCLREDFRKGGTRK